MATLRFNAGAAVVPFMEALLSARDGALEMGVDGAHRVEALAGLVCSMDEAAHAFQQDRGVPFPDGFEVSVLVDDLKEARRVLADAEEEAANHGFKPGPGLSRATYEAEVDQEWGEILAGHVLAGEVQVLVGVDELAEEALNAAAKLIQDALGVETDDLAARFFDGELAEVAKELFAKYALAEIAARNPGGDADA